MKPKKGDTFYHIDLGKYMVISTTDTHMVVKHTQEKGTRTVTIKNWMKLSSKDELKRYRTSRLNQNGREGYFKTLGYLAKNGTFKAEMLHGDIQRFLHNFKAIKGTTPSVEEFLVLPHKTNKYGLQLRIWFKDAAITFPDNITKRNNSKANPLLCNVSSNEWWWELLNMGFNIGSKHNIQEIRNNIPEQYKEAFEQGTNL